MPELVEELRQLIIRAAPDPDQAAPVALCGADDCLDAVIPFSSIIVLGVVVALEDRYGIQVTRRLLSRAFRDGVTLKKLAALIEQARLDDAGKPDRGSCP